jgi:hypothetical protein
MHCLSGCHCAPRSTLRRLFLTATKPESSSPSALPTESYSETVGTGTRINTQPDFDVEQQSSVNCHIGRDSQTS